MTNTTENFPPKYSREFLIKSGVAGGFAGCIAKTVIAPLDRVKILYQTNHEAYRDYAFSRHGLTNSIKRIYRISGVRGLFQGHTATLYRVFPYAGIKFVAYEQVRRMLIRSEEFETSSRRFLSGSLAGICSVFFTYPLELIRVRLAYITGSNNKPRLWNVTSQVLHERDFGNSKESPFFTSIRRLSNFYRGFSVTLMGIFPYAGMSFLAHDLATDFFHNPIVKRALHSEKDERHLNTWSQLTAGALAGVCGQTISYPFEVCRRKMQVGGVKSRSRFLKFQNVVKSTYRDAGLRGFYVGLTIGYLKMIPMVSTSFFIYTRSKSYLGIN
ncbi:mitochondrial carrier, coenzyme A [Schizosaccharomyces osmophilus]|uniref:Mitochondrial carrier, coenzyme A n=1 Tax=Schizosaccharomyces osmophilus TaxID=2545709 RepID=A0AAF0AVW4_9SCHI|nr:mitochondrial carrier, coenzyme A [Schizosaccharomyces osmophilus]WBW74011.1 mitochondrial carrier, coenzyme A [Schizosaccharomyces osmophilus]